MRGSVVDQGVLSPGGVVAQVAFEGFVGRVYLFVARQVALLSERKVANVACERSMRCKITLRIILVFISHTTYFGERDQKIRFSKGFRFEKCHKENLCYMFQWIGNIRAPQKTIS